MASEVLRPGRRTVQRVVELMRSDAIHPGSPVAAREHGRRPFAWAETAAFALVILAVGWFYVWSAHPEDASWHFGERQGDYYNLLVDGMLEGHLSLKVDVPPELLALADPYNPANRPPGMGLHDASLYHGRYYLYFGVAPVVTLLLPFRILTGTALPLPLAVVLFAYAGFLVSAATWWLIRRRYFPAASTIMSTLMLVALGTANMVPVLVRRANIWELPLSGGYFFSAVAICCVYQSLHARRGRTAWLAGASLALGLAIASRPTYLYAIGLIVIPLVWHARQPSLGSRMRRLATCLIAAFLPLAVVGLAMAGYNYARFGNPLEFGVAYQFSGIYEAKAQHFSWSYLPYNLGLYALAPLDWSIYFPFAHQAKLPDAPAGHFGIEEVFGVLNHLVLVWFALLAPFAAVGRSREERSRLLTGVAAIAALGLGTMVTLGFFYAAIGRYETDFLPAFVLLAAIGVWGVERYARARSGIWTGIVRAGLGAVALFSAGVGVLFSLVIYGNFQRSNPRAFARLARVANYPAYAWETRRPGAVGALELALRFPAEPASPREPLVAVGWYRGADHLFVEYGSGHRIRLRHAHDFGGEFVSRWIRVEPGRQYRLRVEMGALYPPEEDPQYARWPAATTFRITRNLHVELDGDVLLDAYQRNQAAAPDRLTIGTDPNASYGSRFSGEVRVLSRDPQVGPVLSRAAERCSLQFGLAAESGGRNQPLLTAQTTSGPVVWYARREGDGIVVGFVGAGSRGESDVVACDASRLHELEVRTWHSTVDHPATKGWVVLDGVPVWTCRSEAALLSRDVRVGRNDTTFDACAPRFAGTIAAVDAFDNEGAATATTFDGLTMEVSLPRVRSTGAREPIVTTGVTGGADFLFVEYLAADRIRFGLEHWGKPGIFSPPLEWAGDAPRTVEVVLGSFPSARAGEAGRRERVTVRVAGHVVWDAPARFYRADPADIFVGRNPVGGTACGPTLSGVISNVKRASDADAPPEPGRGSVQR